MDPARLRELLAVLREAGVKRASIPIIDDGAMAVRQIPLEVEFDAAPEPEVFMAGTTSAEMAAADLIDTRTGQPVDLDEGAPDLARDPGDAIARANFPPKA